MSEKATDRLREKAVTALLSSRSVQAAANKIGVSKRTLDRWLADEGFREAYLTAKKDLLYRGLGNLARKVFDAVEVLGEIAKHRGREFQGARSHAAANIIRLAMDSHVIETFEERLLALEKQGRSHEKFRID